MFGKSKMNDEQIKGMYSKFYVDDSGITDEDLKFVKFIISECVQHLSCDDKFGEAVLDYRCAGTLQAQEAYVRMFDVMRASC